MQAYELTDFEWGVIAPLLPNKPRGVPRVDDRRVLNGIFWVLRTGAPWRALPKEFGPPTTCYNRFVRWRKAGVWDRVMAAVSQAFDGDVQVIDSTSVRVHQHPADGPSPPQTLLQPGALPRAQPHRAVLQPHQTLPSARHALRKARRQLPCDAKAGRHPSLAAP